MNAKVSIDPIVPMQWLQRRHCFSPREQRALENWIQQCGWQPSVCPHNPWSWVSSTGLHSLLGEAVQICAHYETAKVLRERGYYVGQLHANLSAVDAQCYAPGTYTLLSINGTERVKSMRGKANKPMTISRAVRRLDSLPANDTQRQAQP